MTAIDVQLPDPLRAHMERRIADGPFADAGDYLRTLVANDLERFEALRAAIQEGIDSGISPRTIDEILAEAKQEYFASRAQ